MKRIVTITFISVLVILLLLFGLNHYHKRDIEKNANQFLSNLQQERYDEVLNQLLLSDELKKSIKKEDLMELSSILKRSYWEIQYTDFDPRATSRALVLLYLNEAPDSIPGEFDFIIMWKYEGKWQITLDGFLQDIEIKQP
jgi:hypothetical protein